MDINNYMPVREAARRLDVTRQALYDAIARGGFEPVEVYGRLWISIAEIEAYERRTRPDGVKPNGRPRNSTAVAALSAGQQDTDNQT